MLIYYKKDSSLYVTQVILGAGSYHVNTFRKRIEDVHERHRKDLIGLGKNEILVVGNTSVIGNGIFSKNVFAHYTGLGSEK